MRRGTKPTREGSALTKFGLVLLSALLLLSLVGCASTSSQITQSAPASQVAVPVAQADLPASQPAAERDPLKVCSVVPEEDLKEMRGCYNAYFFDVNFTFDITNVNNPSVNVETNFSAVLPDGSPNPDFNGTTAVFSDDNVFFATGPTGNGLLTEVIVNGTENLVVSNVNYIIKVPDATLLSPTINVLPAASLSGIGIK
jgi:hypothetical protein